MLFKHLSIFRSDGHFVQLSRTILAILGKGHIKEEHFCEIILKSGHRLRTCRLKIFLFLALVAILLS